MPIYMPIYVYVFVLCEIFAGKDLKKNQKLKAEPISCVFGK